MSALKLCLLGSAQTEPGRDPDQPTSGTHNHPLPLLEWFHRVKVGCIQIDTLGFSNGHAVTGPGYA